MPWKCSQSECGDKVLWNDSKSKFYLWNSCFFKKISDAAVELRGEDRAIPFYQL